MEQQVQTDPGGITLEELLELNHIDLFPEENNEPTNSMIVSRQIHTIRRLEQQIERYDQQQRESKSFYEERAGKCEERIAFLKQSIKAFLDQNGLKNVQTPNGTAYQKVVTVKQWPEDEVLLAWVDLHLPAAIRVKREPDKKVIGEHITKTGDTPETYREERETRIYLR